MRGGGHCPSLPTSPIVRVSHCSRPLVCLPLPPHPIHSPTRYTLPPEDGWPVAPPRLAYGRPRVCAPHHPAAARPSPVVAGHPHTRTPAHSHTRAPRRQDRRTHTTHSLRVTGEQLRHNPLLYYVGPGLCSGHSGPHYFACSSCCPPLKSPFFEEGPATGCAKARFFCAAADISIICSK